MRTTLTLDDSLARRLKELAHGRQTSFKQVVNEALHRGLDEMTAPPQATAYRTRPRSLGAFRGVDPARLGQTDDEADDVHRMNGGQAPA